MKNNLFKKSTVLLLVTALMLSMTACGGGGKDSSGGKTTKENTKDMVFQGSEMTIEGIQGDISQYIVKGDKLYFTTYEWIEKGSGKEDASEDDGDNEAGEAEGEAESEDITQQGSADDTSEDNGEEAAEEDTSEENEEEGTEEGTSEENEEKGTEEDSSEENGEEGTGEDASDEQEATDNEEYEEIEGETISRMYSADLDGSNVQEITLPKLDENSWISNMLVDDGGNIVFLMSSYDSKTESQNYMALKMDGTGKELAKQDITKALNLGQEDYINSVKIDGKGRMIVCFERSVKVLDENFQFVDEIKMNDNAWIDGIAVSKDGTVLGGFGGEKVQVMELDIEGKKWGNPVELDISYFSSSDSLMDGFGSYDFYYKDDSGIYGYILAEKKADKIMDYVASNISSDRSYGINPIAEDTMLGMEWNDEGSVFMRYTKVDPSQIVDKTPIVVTATYVDDRLKSAAIEFNKTNDKYQIEFKDYSNEEDGDAKMSADIVAGNVGDIICLNNLPIEQYAAKGLLEDLTPYFDKDEEINTSDIVPSIYKAMQIDGKLYYFSPSFSMVTLVAKTEDVGTETGWTFDDLKALLDKKGEGAQPFYSNNKSDMLYTFL
ncbi:MAG: extracellular solute-binding protein, partial [Lachnospiraceae bacterium]|nr:extracellular solute-binding protein [Lachnospiraceae bacterium]